MAGEWIPIRTDIFDCPQVVRILSELCPNSVQDSSERVRKTSMIIGALIRTWSLFDRYTEDGKLDSYNQKILDQLVGIEGFSQAIASVGWLIIHENALEMPEFSKYLSKTAKSRMKDSQRKKAQRKLSESCPKNVQSKSDKNRTTIQKNTIQEKDTNPPKSPKGESVGFNPESVSFPSEIDTPEMRAAWLTWCQHRRELRKKLTPTSVLKQLGQLAVIGPVRAVAMIEHSISKGYSGLYESTTTNTNGQPQKQPTLTDRLASIRMEDYQQ